MLFIEMATTEFKCDKILNKILNNVFQLNLLLLIFFREISFDLAETYIIHVNMNFPFI